MADHPYKPFNDAVAGKVPNKDKQQTHEAKHIRDKDNAAHTPPPPRFALGATTRQAPRGAKGIKRDLKVSNDNEQDQGFKLSGPGDLKREFKPFARNHKKDHGIER